MTYQDTVSWMFTQLPMYQKQGKSAFRKDLTNTLKLSEYLNHPERNFKSVHVAGTNGKGSTSHMLASILQEAGYKVGLYTSPHLKDFRERIKINGQVVSKQFVMGFIKRNRTFLEANALSFFEMTVGMAFDYFSKEKVDIAIVEVGMGGRLDSTNIIVPEVSVITNIGFDHMQFLGNSLKEIAFEKAGIIKPGIPVVIGETQIETTAVFLEIAKKNKSAISFADKEIKQLFESDLKGNYQEKNLKTVVQTIVELNKQGYNIREEHIKNGLLKVVANTGLMGRWQVLQENPKVVCDTAHNKEGLGYIVKQLKKEEYNCLHIVFGVVNDKDLNAILPILPKKATYYFCKPDIPRGMDAQELKQSLEAYGFVGKSYDSVNQAYNDALSKAEENDFIYIGGSTFVVAEIV